MSLRAWSVIGALFVVGACTHTVEGTGSGSSSSGGAGAAAGRLGIDANHICSLLTECGLPYPGTEALCLAEFRAIRTTAACKAKLDRATCETLALEDPGCFPSCSGTPAVCNGDGTIVVCTKGGKTFTYACADICEAGGATYSGECSVTSTNGTVSDTGAPKCWCF